MKLHNCPRCAHSSLEILRSHSYCMNCNYSGDTEQEEDLSIPHWVLSFLKDQEKKKRRKRKNTAVSSLVLGLGLGLGLGPALKLSL